MAVNVLSLEESTLRLGLSRASLITVTNAAEIEIALENSFDVQEKKGASKSRPKFDGCKPADVQVQWIVMPDEEDAFWTSVVPLIRPRSPRTAAQQLQIDSPPLLRAGITKVILLKSKIGRPTARDGRPVSMSLLEWTPNPIDPNLKDQQKPPGLNGRALHERAK